jgi:hypothetical protein
MYNYTLLINQELAKGFKKKVNHEVEAKVTCMPNVFCSYVSRCHFPDKAKELRRTRGRLQAYIPIPRPQVRIGNVTHDIDSLSLSGLSTRILSY